MPDPVFHVRKVSKVYRMGEIEVHALRDVDLDLFPGEFVVLLGRTVIWSGEKVLKVPQSALFRQGQGWSVFAIEGGRAKRREVEIGHRNQAVAEILNGIGVGEDVILHPSNQLRVGVRVRAQ